MPCRDDYPEPTREEVRRSFEKEFRHNSDLAEIFCATMVRIEQLDEGSSDPILLLLPEKAQKWWNEHKERDRKKVEAERRELERKQAVQAAYDKLTPEERKLLGVRKPIC